MKHYINKIFNLFGFKIIRKNDPIDPLEIFTPLNSINTSRFLYYQNLFKDTESIDGDIVKCGVGMGRSFMTLSLLLINMLDKGIDFLMV